jgi:SAM-dependent methyltransferase
MSKRIRDGNVRPAAPADVDAGRRRREPRVWDAGYVLLRTLSDQIKAQARLKLDHRGLVDIVDIGCGSRPYEPIFQPYARTYLGVDIQPGPSVDVVAPAESLPLGEKSFDCAVCSQVLEHSSDPRAVTAEIFRVLRREGVAFVSTHGVAPYHAAPGSSYNDYWRWTHAGLERMFREAGPWRRVEVFPNGGEASALAYLFGRELEIVAAKLGIKIAATPFVLALNLLAWNVDRGLGRLSSSHPPHLAPNYLTVAIR